MSRFFKSAAFPILIVVVLAFFAQKLIGNSSHSQKQTFGNLLSQLDSGQVKSLTLKEKDNTASVTLTDGQKYTVGFPDQYTPELIASAQKNVQPAGFDIQGRASNGWLSLLTYILPFVIFIGFWIFLMNQVQGGGSKVMSFGKSRAKRMSVDSPKITFRDVAGVDEAVEELHEIKEFLENPKKFQALGARIPKGVLLYGPPGTGKTLLARAVAGEAGVPFFSISGSDFVEMFVGVGAIARARPVRAGQAELPLHHLHGRDRRRRAPSRRRTRRRSRRARADAEPAARRDGRLRDEGQHHPDRRHQPSRHPRPGAAAARALRPPDRRRPARSPRAQEDPRGPHPRQAAGARDRRRRAGRPDTRASPAPICRTSSTRPRCSPRATASARSRRSSSRKGSCA